MVVVAVLLKPRVYFRISHYRAEQINRRVLEALHGAYRRPFEVLARVIDRVVGGP